MSIRVDAGNYQGLLVIEQSWAVQVIGPGSEKVLEVEPATLEMGG